MTGVTLIANERLRQQSEKGFSLNSDTQYTNDELVRAAMCYLQAQSRHAIMPIFWPWGKKYWNPKDRKENLIRAGALIAAEIDRLHNTTTKENEKRYLTMTETVTITKEEYEMLLANTKRMNFLERYRPSMTKDREE
ncbi:TPA: hypothetical protein ACPDW7_000999 [Pasteurella multocida]